MLAPPPASSAATPGCIRRALLRKASELRRCFVAASGSRVAELRRLVSLVFGEVLNERFRVGELAGTGGMGAVFRATDLETDQPVAIKVVSCGAHDNVERFMREARVLSELNHPCIVRYHAHGETARGS